MNRATFANLILQVMPMPRFYEPDLTTDPNSPFVRDAADRLVRRSYCRPASIPDAKSLRSRILSLLYSTFLPRI